MKTLTKIKNNYAQEQGYEDWSKMRKATASLAQFDEDWTEICLRAQKAALEKAAEYFDMHWNKSSITNPENLIR